MIVLISLLLPALGNVADGKELAPSSPPSFRASNATWDTWPTGDFRLTRTEMELPPGGPRIYYHCVGGTMGLYSRLVVSSPGAAFEDIAIDADEWGVSPVDDWNSTLNRQISQRTGLFSGSIAGGGSICSCSYYQLDFAEWLIANAKASSTLAYDVYQGSNLVVPSNWYDTGNLPSVYDPWRIQQVHKEPPALAAVTDGWVRFTTLTRSHSDFSTKNKWLRIDDEGKSFVLRALSDKVYEIHFHLIEENPDPSAYSPHVYVRDRDLVTSQTSDISRATAMTFGPAPQGHYYTVSIDRISNSGEETLESTRSPPFTCGPGANGLVTEYGITYSFKSCDDVPCNGDVIDVTPTPGSGSASGSEKARFPFAHILLWSVGHLVLRNR